jgi:hypothetical protein
VTLNPKKVHLGLTTIIFVGHEIDAEGINMSQKRVESTIDFTTHQPKRIILFHRSGKLLS